MSKIKEWMLEQEENFCPDVHLSDDGISTINRRLEDDEVEEFCFDEEKGEIVSKIVKLKKDTDNFIFDYFKGSNKDFQKKLNQ